MIFFQNTPKIVPVKFHYPLLQSWSNGYRLRSVRIIAPEQSSTLHDALEMDIKNVSMHKGFNNTRELASPT